ncbi:MAG: hypothetical protein Q7S74_03245, partial [Nanoarchaeota archaeon]|nr:hypothetical protein [Nanoarchaeota archaeon]
MVEKRGLAPIYIVIIIFIIIVGLVSIYFALFSNNVLYSPMINDPGCVKADLIGGPDQTPNGLVTNSEVLYLKTKVNCNVTTDIECARLDILGGPGQTPNGQVTNSEVLYVKSKVGCPLQAPTCYDSDANDTNPEFRQSYTAGFDGTMGIKIADSCDDSNTLFERKCMNSVVSGEHINCKNFGSSFSCVNGACVNSGIVSAQNCSVNIDGEMINGCSLEGYENLSSDTIEVLFVLRALEESISNSNVDDIFAPTVAQKQTFTQFINSVNGVDSPGIAVVNKSYYRVFEFPQDRTLFVPQIDDNAQSINYYLVTYDNREKILFASKNKSQQECTVTYGNDFQSIYDDLRCVFSNTIRDNPDSPRYLFFNGIAQQNIRNYLDEQETRGVVTWYDFDNVTGEVEINYTFSDVPSLYEIYLSENNLYGPIPNVTDTAFMMNDFVNNQTFFVSYEGILGTDFYAAEDPKISIAVLQTLVSDWPYNEKASKIVKILKQRNVDVSTCYTDKSTIFSTNTSWRWDNINTNATLESMDSLCNIKATEQGLKGNYKAWFSTQGNNARDRLYHSTTPYVLPTGEVVANNFDDLINGQIRHPISNYLANDLIVTSTDENGYYAAGSECTRSCSTLDRNGNGYIDSDGSQPIYYGFDHIAFNVCKDRKFNQPVRITNETDSSEEFSYQGSSISNGKVVWWRAKPGSGRGIYMCDFAKDGQCPSTNTCAEVGGGCLVSDKKTYVTFDNNGIPSPKISKDIIIYNMFEQPPVNWSASGGTYRVLYYYDIFSHQTYKIYEGINGYTISDNIIAWQAKVCTPSTCTTNTYYSCNVLLGANSGGCQATNKIAISVESYGQLSKHRSGDIVVYQNGTATVSEIFACNVVEHQDWCVSGGAIQVTNDGLQNSAPAISGSRIVWWAYNRNLDMQYVKECDLTKNGQSGGCLANDSKIAIDTSQRLGFPSIEGTKIVYTRIIGKTTDGYDNYDVFQYDLSNNSLEGCGWADLNNDSKIDDSDASLWNACYYKLTDKVGGFIVGGNASAMSSAWTNGKKVSSCGSVDKLNLYCVEQPEDDQCSASASGVTAQRNSSIIGHSITGNAITGNAVINPVDPIVSATLDNYYDTAHAVVPYGKKAVLFQLITTKTLEDVGNRLEQEREFRRLSKFGYIPIVVSLKRSIFKPKPEDFKMFEKINYYLRDPTVQIVYLDAHGSSTDGKFLLECWDKKESAKNRLNHLVSMTGSPFKTLWLSQGCIPNNKVYGFWETVNMKLDDDSKGGFDIPGWGILATYDDLFSVSTRKSMLFAGTCYGGTCIDAPNVNQKFNDIMSSSRHVSVYTFSYVRDLRTFMDYFLTERRYNEIAYTKSGLLFTPGSIFGAIHTQWDLDSNMYHILAHNCSYIINPGVGDRLFSDRILADYSNKEFCYMNYLGGRGPPTEIAPRVTDAGVIAEAGVYGQVNGDIITKGYIISFNTPIYATPGTPAPVNKDSLWVGANGPSEPDSHEKALCPDWPYKTLPHWVGPSGQLWSNSIAWEFCWPYASGRTGFDVNDECIQDPVPQQYWDDGNLGNTNRILLNTEFWSNRAERDSWPDGQFEKVTVTGSKIKSWPAKIPFNGNPKAGSVGGSNAWNAYGYLQDVPGGPFTPINELPV